MDFKLFFPASMTHQNVLGLKSMEKKTEAMCLGPESDLFVDGIKLKNVDRFKYLGSFVNQACNLKTEITARI